MDPTERSGHLCPELLAFYGDDEGTNSSGYTLDAILNWPDEDWELQHDFIQWLFATDEPSMYNPDAPVLDAATVSQFRPDPLLRHRLRRSFDRWLAFCGIIRTGDGLAFDNPNPDVWNRPNHNWLRISRVLRSLNLLGLPDEAQAFFTLLTSIRAKIDPTTWEYWERAAGQRT
ncbi:MAG: opioid growth factor receptor-related protein [Gemmataceae bacterium]